MIVRVLTRAGHEIIESPDGVDGLRKFHSEAPAVVITDIMMPHRDGIETIREMRETGSTIGIIAISGGGRGRGTLYLTLSKEFGADAIIQKPFFPEEITTVLDQLLDRLRAEGRQA